MRALVQNPIQFIRQEGGVTPRLILTPAGVIRMIGREQDALQFAQAIDRDPDLVLATLQQQALARLAFLASWEAEGATQ